jgi:hypothetical protein
VKVMSSSRELVSYVSDVSESRRDCKYNNKDLDSVREVTSTTSGEKEKRCEA